MPKFKIQTPTECQEEGCGRMLQAGDEAYRDRNGNIYGALVYDETGEQVYCHPNKRLTNTAPPPNEEYATLKDLALAIAKQHEECDDTIQAFKEEMRQVLTLINKKFKELEDGRED